MDREDEQLRSVWLDVTTLAAWRRPPTGISRTLLQVLRHWPADAPLRLCRYDAARRIYLPADRMLVCPASPAQPAQAADPAPPATPIWPSRRRASLVPPDLREAFWHLGQAGRHAGRWTRDLLRRGGRVGQRALARLQRPLPPATFARGDVLLIGGTSWRDGPSVDVLQALRVVKGMRVAHLVYDITPLRHRHLCDPNLTGAMATWLPGVLANSDVLLTISGHSRRDLEEYAHREGLPLPPVEKVRLGDEPGDDEGESAPAELLARPGPFVLYVSTVGLNKNQGLLLQVWRRLIERHGGGVPTLVLAGQPGWRAEVLLRELRADAALSRHVVHLAKPADRQLRWLYKRCLFTLFPSHYEGWGLPVAEALALGKCCVASDAASLPEVGGRLVEYHDPLDGPGCQRLVERALLEPGWLACREERIRREYRATSWRECARQVCDVLADKRETEQATNRRAA